MDNKARKRRRASAVAAFEIGDYRKIRRPQRTLAGTEAAVDRVYRIIDISPIQGRCGRTFLYRLAEVSVHGRALNLRSRKFLLELTQWRLKHHTRTACLVFMPNNKRAARPDGQHRRTRVVSADVVSSRRQLVSH